VCPSEPRFSRIREARTALSVRIFVLGTLGACPVGASTHSPLQHEAEASFPARVRSIRISNRSDAIDGCPPRQIIKRSVRHDTESHLHSNFNVLKRGHESALHIDAYRPGDQYVSSGFRNIHASCSRVEAKNGRANRVSAVTVSARDRDKLNSMDRYLGPVRGKELKPAKFFLLEDYLGLSGGPRVLSLATPHQAARGKPETNRGYGQNQREQGNRVAGRVGQPMAGGRKKGLWVALLSLPIGIVFGGAGVGLLASEKGTAVALGALLILLGIGTSYVGAMYL